MSVSQVLLPLLNRPTIHPKDVEDWQTVSVSEVKKGISCQPFVHSEHY